MPEPGDLIPTFLTGCPNGAPLKITGTAIGSQTTIDTAVSGTTNLDIYHLWANNTHTADVDLTITVGGNTDPDHIALGPYTIPAKSGAHIVLDGLHVNNSKVIAAFASVTNEITVTGYKYRRTGGD